MCLHSVEIRHISSWKTVTKKHVHVRDSPGNSDISTASMAGWTSNVGRGASGSISSSATTLPPPFGMPSPSPTPPVFGNLLLTGDGAGEKPEGARLWEGAHWPEVAGGVEAEATREVGDKRESNPVEKDEDRLCVGRRRCCDVGGWCSDEVMSILPPPITDRFRSAVRTELSFWFCSGEA
jgi:hypothetical protein